MISLPKNRIYTVYIWFWPTLLILIVRTPDISRSDCTPHTHTHLSSTHGTPTHGTPHTPVITVLVCLALLRCAVRHVTLVATHRVSAPSPPALKHGKCVCMLYRVPGNQSPLWNKRRRPSPNSHAQTHFRPRKWLRANEARMNLIVVL